jgi:hypothetical protein
VFHEAEALKFQNNRHIKVLSLSAILIGRLYPQKIFLVLISVSQPQDRSAAGRIMSKGNSSDVIGNRTRDFPYCSAVPQPTVPPRALMSVGIYQ